PQEERCPVMNWLEDLIVTLASWAPDGSFLNYPMNVRALLGVILVSLFCGAVGSRVGGNRVAFFRDALPLCAFAGVTLGLLLGLLSGARSRDEFEDWVTPVMLAFGVLVGLGIVYVREKTALASDTVIAVYFALALGLGAILLKAVSGRGYFHPEN